MLLALYNIILGMTLETCSVIGALIFFTMIVKTIIAIKATMTKIAKDVRVTIGAVVVWTILSVTRVTGTAFTRVMLCIFDVIALLAQCAPITSVHESGKRGTSIVMGVRLDEFDLNVSRWSFENNKERLCPAHDD